MRCYIDKLMIIVQFVILAAVLLLVGVVSYFGASGAFGSVCYAALSLLMWPFLIARDKVLFIAIKISGNQLSSHLFFKKRCTVSCDRPVYISFFKELLRPVDQYEAHYYVMVSNIPIPEFEPDTRFETFDMSTQIIFPDTEKTRQAIAPLLASKFCILQGDDPPPVELLRKKKKEEPPVVKREKSPDDPPPFTGKWNGRF